MAATRLYRIAAMIFVLFAVGHTFGFLSFRPPSAEGRAAYDAMNNVRFVVEGHSFSYGDFYRGFGLFCTMSMVLSVFLCWHLGELARTNPQAIGIFGWVFFLAQVAGAVLSLLYFGLPPMVLSSVLTVLLGAAAWLSQRGPLPVPARAAT
jgi:hypothetical protein